MQNTLGMWIIGLLVVLFGILYASRSPQEPAYQVIKHDQPIRIVRYDPRILAKVSLVGQRSEVIQQGFSVLADFIFGANQDGVRIKMTAPVMQTGTNDQWQVAFVMPEAYQLTTLPRPNNTSITMSKMPAGTYAVIRFAGKATDETLLQQQQLLEQYLRAHGIRSIGSIWYAFYNPPWIPGFLRRNEVMVAVVWPQP